MINMIEGYRVEIHNDNDCNPREWSNLGFMYCLHNKYLLGDPHGESLQALQALEVDPDVVSLPLYLYDHSGLAMSYKPFSCPWDSGKVGIIAVTKEAIRRAYDVRYVTKAIKDRAISELKSEVETYNDYLSEQVYQFSIYSDAAGCIFIDGCSGIFGLRNAMEQAADFVKALADKEPSQLDLFQPAV